MKPGTRVLGVAESYTGDRSTLAGVVMTVDGRVDGLCFGSCTVGGTDVTAAIVDLIDRIDREDVRAILVAGVALAWYNIVDFTRLHEATDVPVIAVTFEASDGLEEALASAFEGDVLTDRLERYRALPPRREFADDELFVRSVGVDREWADDLVDATTPANASRPEVLRVAKLAARAADEVRA